MKLWDTTSEQLSDGREPEHLAVFRQAQDDIDRAANTDVCLVYQEGSDGLFQPVFWEMRLHVHDQDCGRA
jgi:hypothetical protein